MSELSLLDTILEPGGLSVVFQPVFEVRPEGRRLHALECLIRGPRGTNLESPGVLFEYVRRKQAEDLVDRACVSTVLEAASQLPGDAHLFVNVLASTVDREFVTLFVETAEAHQISLGRLTVEIVEHAPCRDERSFHCALDRLRVMGVWIALDDVGQGHSNYRRILDCCPNYVKIDRYFVQGVHADFRRRAILESASHLARTFEARVVAEGVEDVADLHTIAVLGIDLVQGHLLSPALSIEQLLDRGLLPGFPRRQTNPFPDCAVFAVGQGMRLGH